VYRGVAYSYIRSAKRAAHCTIHATKVQCPDSKKLYLSDHAFHGFSVGRDIESLVRVTVEGGGWNLVRFVMDGKPGGAIGRIQGSVRTKHKITHLRPVRFSRVKMHTALAIQVICLLLP
jgi:hypothetical protein